MIDPADMSDEQLRVEIAEWCGWRNITRVTDGHLMAEHDDFICAHQLPNYPHDLNAVHEAEKKLSREQQWKYAEILSDGIDEAICDNETYVAYFMLAHSDARQRCIALVKVVRGL